MNIPFVIKKNGIVVEFLLNMDPNVTASLIKHKRTTLERIEKYISKDYFTDVNLFGKLYPKRKDLSWHWSLPGGEGSWQDWDINTIFQQSFSPVNVGETFGPSWSTHWFKIEFSVPREWAHKEVRLRWKSQSEAMLWDTQGRPLQGLSTGTSHQIRSDYQLSKNWSLEDSDLKQIYFVEMSCSRMFGVGKGGMINPPDPDVKFTLELAEICVFDTDVYSLFLDLLVLHDLAKHLSEDQRGYRALYAGNQMINYIISGNLGSAKEVSKEFFSKKSGENSLTVALIGNCHIDSAWLWPFSETKRKCARSWASTIRLMNDYPELVFACSQAQQFQWVKDYYPSLYNDIKEKVKVGKFVPVGATWVEMDGLIPSILIYHYFLTQKLSWNLVNEFPHHTFIWEGIDGSSVLAHFPPGNSYELNEEVIRTERNLKDKGRVSIAAFLYGYGDGGGGPTQDMLERARRLENIDGCSKLVHMTPDQMFERMSEERRNLCRWTGELYLELHNGTYTSQAKTKYYNRLCEFELRKTEFLLFLVSLYARAEPREIKSKQEVLEAVWKNVLLNQFHDVLPGSSIGMVYQDTDKAYEEILTVTREVSQYSIKKLSLGDIELTIVLENQFLRARISKIGEILELSHKDNSQRNVFERRGGPIGKGNVITIYDDVPLFWDAWDIMDYHTETRIVLNSKENAKMEIIQPMQILVNGVLKTTLQYSFKISSLSFIKQKISLSAVDPFLSFETEVEWHELHKLLKVEFETGILSRNASYDIQFGHVERPTHKNTSWDSAKFEVCGHKWANISEYGCGLSILNDCKYGWSCNGGTLALSLLRAPKAPDDQCDMGTHFFKYAVLPHTGSLQESPTMKSAYEYNCELSVFHELPFQSSINNIIEIEGEGVMIESIKLAEGSCDSAVIRLLRVAPEFKKAYRSNGMEKLISSLPLLDRNPEAEEKTDSGFGYIQLHFHSFEIQTVLLVFSSSVESER
ncbi:Alpha-mannosidase [Armadillidium vulgare]|nr:Alpha-mannosidase [Armadillidium vulgare]